MSNQSAKQAAIRALTGTALTYEGDWHALFDSAAVPAGPFNQRMLTWLNGKLGASHTNLSSAMQAYAAANGAYNWNSLRTIA